MSALLKLFSKCKQFTPTILSNSTRQISLNTPLFERAISHRYTIGKRCKKPNEPKCKSPKAKAGHCKKYHKPPPSCSTEIKRPGKSSPPCSAKRSSTTGSCRVAAIEKNEIKNDNPQPKAAAPPKRMRKNCKPCQKNPCDVHICGPECGLSKSKNIVYTNECQVQIQSPKVKSCPKGDWEK